MLRLQDGGDEAAWEEFVAIYRPVIVRMATLKGLQHSDAEDLAQKVLLSVAKKIPEWEHDPARAKFRTWLARVVRNATLNSLSRMPADRGDGRTTAMLALAGHADANANDSEVFELEWRREAFRWIADQIREEFQPPTWEAFWLTAVDGVSPDDAAKRTGKSIGAVYVSRTRVMQRIQAKLQELTGELAHGRGAT
jgi:RNA polymerase sigma-70 factor, ECF subfamily